MTPEEERQLVLDLADLQAKVALLAQEVADFILAGDLPPTTAGSRLFSTVETWVDAYFVPVFQRPLGGEFRWCAEWFEHAEARERLDALWRSWEAMRRDEPAGLATWLTSLLDPQVPILMGPRGPFCSCTPERHDAERGC